MFVLTAANEVNVDYLFLRCINFGNIWFHISLVEPLHLSDHVLQFSFFVDF